MLLLLPAIAEISKKVPNDCSGFAQRTSALDTRILNLLILLVLLYHRKDLRF
jgi:hypothetical protein